MRKDRYLLKKQWMIPRIRVDVLYMLTQEQLAHISLPLGGLRKTEVREIAENMVLSMPESMTARISALCRTEIMRSLLNSTRDVSPSQEIL